jgi:hypothetical protein
MGADPQACKSRRQRIVSSPTAGHALFACLLPGEKLTNIVSPTPVRGQPFVNKKEGHRIADALPRNTSWPELLL